jgi:hypothetical protein
LASFWRSPKSEWASIPIGASSSRSDSSGYSTFSTFEYEAVRLLQDRELRLGMIYCVGSIVIGGIATISGIALGSWI